MVVTVYVTVFKIGELCLQYIPFNLQNTVLALKLSDFFIRLVQRNRKRFGRVMSKSSSVPVIQIDCFFNCLFQNFYIVIFSNEFFIKFLCTFKTFFTKVNLFKFTFYRNTDLMDFFNVSIVLVLTEL